MNSIKTLTLTIADISEIFAISDPMVREQAISIIQSAASDPENINTDHYKDCHPIIQKLIQKLQHRVELSRRRAEARARRKAEQAAEAARQSKNNAFETLYRQRAGVKAGTLEVKINESVARRLLWIRQNFPAAVDAVRRVVAAYEAEDEMARIVLTNLTSMFNFVTGYLNPLTEAASAYFRTPKCRRSSSVIIPAC